MSGVVEWCEELLGTFSSDAPWHLDWKEEKVGAGREGAGWLDGVQGCGPGCM